MKAKSQVELSFEQRIEKLEVQNRRLKCLIILFGLLGMFIISAGMQTIQEQLIIRDRNNTVRFDMGVDKFNGRANALLIFDMDGRKRVDIGVDASGNTGIVLLNPDGSIKWRI
ncbi:MAG: hypothetical protein WC962_09620 [Phycisphaerae bacterium]|jgi:hypothetical protein